ncbi:MAG: hypothetical protein DRP56_10920 [Planctomycetota bacterium]|nr:MAG: hypothetical protein DRP56_10920 [Planctomycetota bacterium]
MPHEPTKRCPFCGEVIHAEALKCRYCREFLEDDDGLPVSHHARRGLGRNTTEPDLGENADDFALFSVTPSLWGLLGFFFTAAMFMVIAMFLLSYPIGEMAYKLFSDVPNEKIIQQIGHYTSYVGMATGVLTLLMVILRAAQLKSIYYEVSPDRIEYGRGIFSRKIDNLDMFRVVDMKLHRSLLDCLTGVGSVTLVTKDDTDPVFELEKVADPKQLYDVLKKASLEADRKQGVVHLD